MGVRKTLITYDHVVEFLKNRLAQQPCGNDHDFLAMLEEGSVTLFSTLWKSPSKDQRVPNVTKTELQDAARRSLKFFKESKAGRLPGERIDVGEPRV